MPLLTPSLSNMWFIILFAIAGLWQASSIAMVTGFLSGWFVNSCFCCVCPGIIHPHTTKTSCYTLVCSTRCLFSGVLTLEFIYGMCPTRTSKREGGEGGRRTGRGRERRRGKGEGIGQHWIEQDEFDISVKFDVCKFHAQQRHHSSVSKPHSM